MRMVCRLMMVFVCSASVASAGPPSREVYERHREDLAQAKRMLTGAGTDAEKFQRLAEMVREERVSDYRRALLSLGTLLPGKGLESFLAGQLRSDGDWTVRAEAATLLGKFGAESAVAPLAEAAAADKITLGMRGDVGGDGTARRSAIFALAELGRRLPGAAKPAISELRKLPAANDADKRLFNEGLGDARMQALFQLTRERELLGPFFERLKSDDVETRVSGVVAFQYFDLSQAPEQLVKLAQDPSAEVRSWVMLVLGRIGDAKTVPLLVGVAKDANADRGVRCNAIGSLGQMRAADAKAAMEQLLSDESVRVNAAIALSQITGKRHPLVPEGYGGPDWPGEAKIR
ncbi:MAG TPA: HEAT repeat domain-containing protein [Planctomycetaceae bacterium]|nr:HEAT repeat domain-containing protein [Planctomycetaceae bacterium]